MEIERSVTRFRVAAFERNDACEEQAVTPGPKRAGAKVKTGRTRDWGSPALGTEAPRS